MKKLLSKIKTSFTGMRESGEIRFSDIRSSRFVYYMAYALELVLYTVRGAYFFNCGVGLFGLNSWTILYVVHMAASLVVMLLWSDKFKPLIHVSVTVMIVGFLPWIFLPQGYLRLAFAMIGMAGLGGAVTSARCGYAFATNNAEKLFGMVLMFAATIVVRILLKYNVNGVLFAKLLPILLLFALSFCLIKFKETDFEVKEKSTKEDTKGLYWALAFFIAYFAIDAYAAALLYAHFDGHYTAYIMGSVIPCLIFPLLFTRLKLNTWYVWNIFFVFSLAMGLCAIFAPQLNSRSPEILFCNLSHIGWPLCIYTLGCAQRRFASYALLKKSTVLFVLCSPLTTLSGRLLRFLFPDAISIIAFIYVLVLVVAFLILSPFSFKHLFSAVWVFDIYKEDMSLLSKKVEEIDRFARYNLTPRQREIAMLLLSAKTGRQIAAELRLSESTVRMHISDLYKKLDINSRTELFRIFGVAESNTV